MDKLAEAVNLGREALGASGSAQMGLPARVNEAIAAVEMRLSAHNLIEEEKVYRWIEPMLNESERDQLRAEILHQLQNLPARFRNEASRAADDFNKRLRPQPDQITEKDSE